MALAGCTGSTAIDEADPAASTSTITTSTAADTTVAPSTESTPIQEAVADHADCLEQVSAVAAEQWSFCRGADGLELIAVEWVAGDVVYNELFAILDGSLVYASESTAVLENGERIGPWSVWYVIEDNRVIDYSSLGLGPTESDDWDPEAVLDRWATREPMAAEIRSTN